MARMRYFAEYPTASATESAIAELGIQIDAMANVPGDVIDYTTAMGIIGNLRRLRDRLRKDLRNQRKAERRTWEELSPKEQAAYADAVDLLEGETMHDWWELYQDSLEER